MPGISEELVAQNLVVIHHLAPSPRDKERSSADPAARDAQIDIDDRKRFATARRALGDQGSATVDHPTGFQFRWNCGLTPDQGCDPHVRSFDQSS
jgi:hypothetical protein